MNYWTYRADANQQCPKSPSAVTDQEDLARLLHSKNSQPFADPIRRSELFPQKGMSYSNVCGDSDGVSVVRCSTLAEDDILVRAEVLAKMREGRDSRGAIVADAGTIRSVRLIEHEDVQIFYIYDDPRDDDSLHAVVRGSQVIKDKGTQDYLKSILIDFFDKSIIP